MIRYSVINQKRKREIVLLKSTPCKWGQCSFCDYISDNSEDISDIIEKNREILKSVTGMYGELEVINSGSVFELPHETLKEIKKISGEKKLHRLYFESHYLYKKRLNEIKDYFNIPIIFKCGIETFDESFRNHVLKKGIQFNSVREVADYFDSVCIMVGIEGQTKEMIERDIDILLQNFPYGCVNVYTNNSTAIKADLSLIEWFEKNYQYLNDIENIDVLWSNTDFGVGGDING